MVNNIIFFEIFSLAHQSIFFDWQIRFFAIYFPYLVIIFALVFIFLHHDILKSKNKKKELVQKGKEIFFVSLSVILAWFSSIIFKVIFQLPRPFVKFPDIIPFIRPTDYSFPSGHATFFMAVAVAIYLYHKKTGYLFILFAVIIGLSRIVAGVHFPLDVFVGWILGGFISYILIKHFRKL